VLTNKLTMSSFLASRIKIQVREQCQGWCSIKCVGSCGPTTSRSGPFDDTLDPCASTFAISTCSTREDTQKSRVSAITKNSRRNSSFKWPSLSLHGTKL